MPQKQFKFALGYLALTALWGAFMRGAPFLGAWGLNLGHVLHGHSHIAFQGWAFNASFIAFAALFLNEEERKRGRYGLQFRIFQGIFPLILITFTLGGYFWASISVSTLFQLVAYWFLGRAALDLRRQPVGPARNLALWALLFFFLSTLGPWALAVISAKGMAGSVWYHRAVYFFLHFQYNGAFVLGLLAFWLKSRDQKSSMTPGPGMKAGVVLLAASVGLTYWESLLGEADTPTWFFALAGTGVLLQGAGFGLFLHGSKGMWRGMGWEKYLLAAGMLIFILKTLLQAGSCLPGWQDFFFGDRNLIVAYLHLVLIGLISFGYLGLALAQGWLKRDSGLLKAGLAIFAAGFVVTEVLLLLFGLDLQVPFGAKMLFYGSLAMFVGALGLLTARG